MSKASLKVYSDPMDLQSIIDELQQQNAMLIQENQHLADEKHRLQMVQRQEIIELRRLYEQVTGDVGEKPKWNARDYALAIYHYLDNIIALAPGHIFWLDRDNVYLGCNNEQAVSLEWSSRQTIVGKRNKDTPWNAHADMLDANNNKVMESGKSGKFEEAINIAGCPHVFLSYKAPLRNQLGEVIGLLGTALDITPQKQAIAEALKDKIREEQKIWARSEYIQGIQQQLLPIITLLLQGSNELMREEQNSSKHFKLEALYQAAEKLQELFQGIINYDAMLNSKN